MILRRYLHPLRLKQIDTLVLGCTHYPLLKHLIGPRIGKRVNLIDSSIEMALQVRDFISSNTDVQKTLRESKGTPSRYFVSDTTEAINAMAAKIFARPIQLEKVDI